MRYMDAIKDVPGLELWEMQTRKNSYVSYDIRSRSNSFKATMYVKPQSHGALEVELHISSSGERLPVREYRSNTKTFDRTVDIINSEISMLVVHSL